MEEEKKNTAYIGIEREENTMKYIAKVFNEPPRQITKAQYNAIVKALKFRIGQIQSKMKSV